jgi:hypothetical protein
MVYVIFEGTYVYIGSLKTNNSHMYPIVKGKLVYPKQDTSMEMVKPRNSDARKNTCFQETCDMETQENRENIKDKNTQYPQKEYLPSGVTNYVTKKISP